VNKLFLLIFAKIFFISTTASQTQTTDTMLKYPLVLVHGIIAHDRESIIDFWGRIPQILQENNVQVFFGNTDAWGDYETNADLLKASIEQILKETNAEKVNIIAHSKGGLDSRYLIWKHDFGDKIASLTTICTPHHGAEVSELIFRRRIVHTKVAAKALKTIGKMYKDSNPDLFRVNFQLRPDYMREFNEKVIMDEQVYTQSYYSTMRKPSDDWVFFYTNRYIASKSGKNDGLVSEQSAQWGDNIVEIKGGISHIEILDIKKRKISGIDIPSIYLDIVKQLSEKGF